MITSDNNLREFARKCSCDVQKSEEFGIKLQEKSIDDETDRVNKMSNDIEEFKKLFGVGEN